MNGRCPNRLRRSSAGIRRLYAYTVAAATELGLQQYRAGTIDFNRVFNLETTQVQQQDQLAVAQGNIALFLIQAYRALGGGWEVRMRQTNGSTPADELPAPRPLAAQPVALAK